MKSSAILMSAAMFLVSSCALSKPKIPAVAKRSKPSFKNVVVLPVSNQTIDAMAPVLIRYFLYRKVKKEGYNTLIKPNDLDQFLREMGIMKGSQIDDSNIQRIGQNLKADGLLQATLFQFRQDMSRRKTTIGAKFQLVDTKTGKIWWAKTLELQRDGLSKIPFRETVNSDWAEKEIRELTKSEAAILPKDLVNEALDSMPDSGDIEKQLEKEVYY